MSAGKVIQYSMTLDGAQYISELKSAVAATREAANELKAQAQEMDLTTTAGGELEKVLSQLNSNHKEMVGVMRSATQAMAEFGSEAALAASEAKAATDGAKAEATAMNAVTYSASDVGRALLHMNAGNKDTGKLLTDASRAASGFNSVQSALSNAMKGNYVGAARAATKATSAFSATLAANPLVLFATALAGVALGVKYVVDRMRQYKEAMADIRKEHQQFLDDVERMEGRDEFGISRSNIDKAYEKQDLVGLWKIVENAEAKYNQLGLEIARKAAAVESFTSQYQLSRTNENKQQLDTGQEELAILRTRYMEQYAVVEEAKAKEAQLNKELTEKDRAQTEHTVLTKREADAKRIADRDAENKRIKENEKSSAKELFRRAEKDKDVGMMSAIIQHEKDDLYRRFGDGYERRLKDRRASDDEITANRAIEDLEDRRDKVGKDEADKKTKDADARTGMKDVLAREDKNAGYFERKANSLWEEANEKYGKWSKEKWGTAGDEELALRKEAHEASKEAKKIRKDEEKDKAKEAAKDAKDGQDTNKRRELSVKAMSIGDVFDMMRGMGGSRMSPEERAAKAGERTAKATEDSAKVLSEIKDNLKPIVT